MEEMEVWQREENSMVMGWGAEHKAAATCLRTKKMGDGEKVLRNHFDSLQLFAAVNLEIVFCRGKLGSSKHLEASRYHFR